MVSSVPKKFGNGLFQLLVQVLRSADKAHRSQPKPVIIQRSVSCLDYFWIISQAEVVVGTEIKDFTAVLYLDFDILRCRDDALGFVEPGVADFFESIPVFL